MSSQRDLRSEIAHYLEARSVSRAPDGLLETLLGEIETTRQRPGWLVPERWMPGGGVIGPGRTRTALVLVAVLALIAVLGVALALLVGSERRPPQIPLGRPGLIVYDEVGDLFVTRPDGTGLTKLTTGPDSDIRPTFSPDGTLIAYESQSFTDLSSALISISPDGRTRMTLADHLTDPGDLSWSPDSRQVAFGARDGSTGGYGLYVADVAGGGARRLGGADLQGVEPSWSPDGLQIAFKHIGACCDTVPTLWMIDADGSNAHPLSTAGGFGHALWNTVWSPDGRQLAFLASGNGGRLDVYVVNADGTAEHDVSDSPEDEYWPSWSPDGTRVAFARMSPAVANQGTLVVINPDGSRPLPFDGSPVNSNSPVWSPDGSHVLAYLKHPDPAVNDNVGLVIFDVTGTAQPTIIPAAGFGSASWQRLAP
jgi:TolB protein